MLWILGTFGLLLFALPVAGVLWMTAVPGRSHTGALSPLKPEQIELSTRLQDHARAIASRPHNVAHPQELERAGEARSNSATSARSSGESRTERARPASANS